MAISNQDIINAIASTINATRRSGRHSLQGTTSPIFTFGRLSNNRQTMDIHVILEGATETALTQAARAVLLGHGGQLAEYGPCSFQRQLNAGWRIFVTGIPVQN